MRIVDGRGKIVPDAFAETRILSLPRGVIAVSLYSNFGFTLPSRHSHENRIQLLVLFNRNHNYIADMLLQINERGKWTVDLTSLSPAQIIHQDYEIFNTARLINSLMYANVVLGDYLAAILGTVRSVPSIPQLNAETISWPCLLPIVMAHRGHSTLLQSAARPIIPS